MATSPNLLEDLVLEPPSALETQRATVAIKQAGAVRTPLVALNWRRPDLPSLEIFLKLETLQPISSFKIRGAGNKLAAVSRSELQTRFGNCVASASAGNMGQGVAYAARALGCECVVVVPDSAPLTKLRAMETLGAHVIKVPYARWWEVLQTGDASPEVGKPHLFVHPVCDSEVVAGNSTLGLEILEDLPDVDAVFCAYGGGGCSCGVGSALRNAPELLAGAGGPSGAGSKRIEMVSVEPATAAPMCASFARGEITPFPDWKASWIDGCGGKSVLKPMWSLAQKVLTHAMKVELEAVEDAVRLLVEKNRVVAEGAGACSVAAVMTAPVEQLRNYKKVVAVVCGGCIDTAVLTRILSGASATVPSASAAAIPRPLQADSADHAGDASPRPRVLSAAEVRRALPMHSCIEATEQALIAFHSGAGAMPLRTVFKLPLEPPEKLGFLGTMPSFCGDYAACKAISVFPANSGSNFSSHQGVVLLWHAAGNGELLLIADAHEITAIRTAAASAVATRLALSNGGGVRSAKILALVGTGAQARSHFEAMRCILPELEEVRVVGRDAEKAKRLAAELTQQVHSIDRDNAAGTSADLKVVAVESVAACVRDADVVCTLTPAREPLLFAADLKPGCHVNAVGACQPQFQELAVDIFEQCGRVLTDSVEACLREPGDVLAYLRANGLPTDAESAAVKAKFVAVGEVLAARPGSTSTTASMGGSAASETGQAGNDFRSGAEKFTVFSSLGIALEDLFAAKVIWEEGLDHCAHKRPRISGA